MAIGRRSYGQTYAFLPGLPRGIRGLLIINTALFLLQFFAGHSLDSLFSLLVLIPAEVVHSAYLWQLGTFLFFHFSIWGFLWNMLALWMFGGELEQAWGTDRFLRFYLMCGAGAGVCVVLTYLLGAGNAEIAGSTPAVYGILAASAALWPDRDVLFIVFPMKMKYFVLIIAGVDFLITYNAGLEQIVLLTGLLWGWLYVRSRSRTRGPSFHPMARMEASYKAWKLRRAKRKFQVYLRKHGSKQDPWVQ